MSEYEHDKIVPYAASHAAKKEQVATMFDHIAKRYDFLNRFLSLGIDQGWRKKAIAYFGQQKINHLLDIATGTADMALMADKTIAPIKITGIDISEGMMQYGRIKITDRDYEPYDIYKDSMRWSHKWTGWNDDYVLNTINGDLKMSGFNKKEKWETNFYFTCDKTQKKF